MTSNELTVAYPGREGAHSAAACDRLFPAARLIALPTFSDVVDSVASGRTPYGVLPIESSLVGPVAETHDLLYESPLSIVAEAILPIHHCLIGPAEVALDDVREVHSHPVALDQCRQLLASLPHATAVAAPTTGDAAATVANLGDATVVAIASDRAARIHGLTIVAENVGDHPEAYTRFVSIAPYTRLDRRDGDWRTAFSFITDHRPGALHRALEPLARHSIDLNLLVSRPIPSRPFRLPLRRRPRRPPAGRRDLDHPPRDDGPHSPAPGVRVLSRGPRGWGRDPPERNRSRRATMNRVRSIEICDVGPRDGLQNEPETLAAIRFERSSSSASRRLEWHGSRWRASSVTSWCRRWRGPKRSSPHSPTTRRRRTPASY